MTPVLYGQTILGAVVGAVRGAIAGGIVGGLTSGGSSLGVQRGIIVGATAGLLVGSIPSISAYSDLAGGLAEAFLGEILLPIETADVDALREHYENLQEAERILQEARELRESVEALNNRSGGWYNDGPCP